ncbi:MAG: FMN-binding protein [Succinivibrionaceae bacterium]|nr:FMN-binding protein [Succinivibrionaceae bacterium]
MRRVKSIAKLAMGLALALSLAGCQKPEYHDGVYSARSFADDRGGYGVITVTLKGGRFAECSYVSYTRDGKIKDRDYGRLHHGKQANAEFYGKAQKAVEGMNQYAGQLLNTQDPDKVDAVTGATRSYEQFQDALEKALEQAEIGN